MQARARGIWTDEDTKALRAKVAEHIKAGRFVRASVMLDNLHANTTMPGWLYSQQDGRIMNAEVKQMLAND